MRSHGDFVQADIDASDIDTSSWDTAVGCTIESILRVRAIVDSLGDKDTSGDGLVGRVRVTELLVRAQAADALPKGVSHGGPGEKAIASSVTLQERLNQRVLDVRVAATGAIFQLLSGLNELAVEYCFSHDFKYAYSPLALQNRYARPV